MSSFRRVNENNEEGRVKENHGSRNTAAESMPFLNERTPNVLLQDSPTAGQSTVSERRVRISEVTLSYNLAPQAPLARNTPPRIEKPPLLPKGMDLSTKGQTTPSGPSDDEMDPALENLNHYTGEVEETSIVGNQWGFVGDPIFRQETIAIRDGSKIPVLMALGPSKDKRLSEDLPSAPTPSDHPVNNINIPDTRVLGPFRMQLHVPLNDSKFPPGPEGYISQFDEDKIAGDCFLHEITTGPVESGRIVAGGIVRVQRQWPTVTDYAIPTSPMPSYTIHPGELYVVLAITNDDFLATISLGQALDYAYESLASATSNRNDQWLGEESFDIYWLPAQRVLGVQTQFIHHSVKLDDEWGFLPPSPGRPTLRQRFVLVKQKHPIKVEEDDVDAKAPLREASLDLPLLERRRKILNSSLRDFCELVRQRLEQGRVTATNSEYIREDRGLYRPCDHALDANTLRCRPPKCFGGEFLLVQDELDISKGAMNSEGGSKADESKGLMRKRDRFKKFVRTLPGRLGRAKKKISPGNVPRELQENSGIAAQDHIAKAKKKKRYGLSMRGWGRHREPEQAAEQVAEQEPSGLGNEERVENPAYNRVLTTNKEELEKEGQKDDRGKKQRGSSHPHPRAMNKRDDDSDDGAGAGPSISKGPGCFSGNPATYRLDVSSGRTQRRQATASRPRNTNTSTDIQSKEVLACTENVWFIETLPGDSQSLGGEHIETGLWIPKYNNEKHLVGPAHDYSHNGEPASLAPNLMLGTPQAANLGIFEGLVESPWRRTPSPLTFSSPFQRFAQGLGPRSSTQEASFGKAASEVLRSLNNNNLNVRKSSGHETPTGKYGGDEERSKIEQTSHSEELLLENFQNSPPVSSFLTQSWFACN